MKDAVKVIQIGGNDWSQSRQIPDNVMWTFRSAEDPETPTSEEEDEKSASSAKRKAKGFDVVIIDGEVDGQYIDFLLGLGAAYTDFYTDRAGSGETVNALVSRKLASRLGEDDLASFLELLPLRYFSGQEGTKIKPGDIIPAAGLRPFCETDGNRALVIRADFGSRMRAALYWKYNIFVKEGKPTELWLEFSRSKGMRVEFKVWFFREGFLCEPLWSRTFTEEDMRQPIVFNEQKSGYLSCELMAQGRGRLEVGQLHFRDSRLDAGSFLAGGRRHVCSGRNEFISYFDPGDLKPPLNVYFSGYRTAEGFEGYFIMKRMGSPFLLIGDPRLEGGGFYLGTPDFEKGVADVIRNALESLGFTSDQLILSGLSMGTFGAAYYACDLQPHAVIIGKPLMSIGNVAANEKRIRPGGFPTSLDVLRSTEGDIGEEEIEKLNERFWSKFDAADFSSTRFIISYMYQDDYDTTGYPDILEHLKGRRIPIISKGLEGRHNDNTSGVVSWFLSRYHSIMREDFGREVQA